MAITECRECGERVSTEAESCPHCGVPKPARPASNPTRNIVFGVVVLVATIWACGQIGGSDSPGSSSSQYAGDYTEEEHRENIDRILEERRENPPPAEREPQPGRQWRQSVETSPIDDSKNVYLRVSGTPIPNRYGGTETPTLWVRCKENTTAVTFSWGVYLGLDEARMITRIDSEPAQTRWWDMATNNEAVGRWYGGSAIPFAKSLFGHEQLFAQVTPYGESAVSTTFDVSGLEERIGPLREACNW